VNALRCVARLAGLALLSLLTCCAHRAGRPDADRAPASAPAARVLIGQMVMDGRHRFVICGAACPQRTAKFLVEAPAAPAAQAQPEPAPPPVIDDEATRIVPELHLYFLSGSASLNPLAAQRLQALAPELARAVALRLHPCTDSTGGPRVNERIARARALTVRRWLAANLPRVAVQVVLDDHPGACYVALNNREDGRRLNRRVDLSGAPMGAMREDSSPALAIRHPRRE